MGGTQDPTPPPAPAAPGNPSPAAAPAGPNALDNLVAAMGMSQLLMVGGALLLLGVDIVLGWLARQYYVGDALWLGAVLIVLGYFLSRRAPAMLPFSYQALLSGGALIIAIVGVRGIVLDLISVLTVPGAWDAIELIGLVLYAVGIVAVAWGAWMMMRGRR